MPRDTVHSCPPSRTDSQVAENEWYEGMQSLHRFPGSEHGTKSPASAHSATVTQPASVGSMEHGAEHPLNANTRPSTTFTAPRDPRPRSWVVAGAPASRPDALFTGSAPDSMRSAG